MEKTVIEQFTRNPKARKMFAFETFKLTISEALCEIMNKQNLSVKQISDITGFCESTIQKLLDDDHDMCISNISDIFSTLGYTLDVKTYKEWLK